MRALVVIILLPAIFVGFTAAMLWTGLAVGFHGATEAVDELFTEEEENDRP